MTLIRTSVQGVPPATCLFLSPFAGDQGDVITAEVTGLNGPKGQCDPYDSLNVARAPTPLEMKVPDRPTAGTYTATLAIYGDNFDPAIWKIVIRGAAALRPAALMVDRDDVLLRSMTCLGFLCTPSQPAETFVHISEKTRQWPLDGITLRQESSGTADFDINRDLAFTFNGAAMLNPGDLRSERWVARRAEPATIGIAAKNLPAGEYKALIRFQAANAVDDEGKLQVRVQVRHSWLWPTILLLIALLLSFFITKVIVMLRRRVVFLQRVNELSTAWLSRMDPLFAVVWVRAMLRQSEELSRRFWLTGQDLIDGRLKQICVIIGVLERASRLHDAFDRFAKSEVFVQRRAAAALNEVLREIDVEAMDDQRVALIRSELDTLSGWTLKTEQYYWESLARAIRDLIGIVTIGDLPADGADDMKALMQVLANALQAPPQTREEMRELEGVYARLKLLWERRMATNDFEQLLQLHRFGRPLEDLFTAADAAAWARVQNAAMQIKLPQDTGADPLESFQPLTFKLEPSADTGVGETYLFLHGLTYCWAFELTNRKRRWKKLWRKPDVIRFTAVSIEPQVAVYAPEAGSLSVRVSATYLGQSVTSEMSGQAAVTIVDSKDYTVDKGFERIEVASFAVAGVIALISGLSLLYAKNPTFGSLSDYLALFLWGVGVDQGKNLAQTLQMSSGK